MTSRVKRLRYQLEWLGLVGATKLVPLLPRNLCRFLASSLGTLASFLDRQGRKVALANLEAAFGEAMSPRRRVGVMRSSYRHFARSAVDLLWSPRLTVSNFRDYIEFENFEETGRNTGPERTFVMACFHYGNFEWLGLACAFAGLPGTIVAEEFKNQRLDEVYRKLRQQSGH